MHPRPLASRPWLAAVLLAAAAARPVVAEQPQTLWPYSEDVTRAFAALTQVSYCDTPEAKRRLLSWECPECAPAGFRIDPSSTRFVQLAEVWQPNSTFVVVSRMKVLPGGSPDFGVGDGCLVSVRGSVTFTNWLKDFEAWSVPVAFHWCEGCYVEDGFYHVAMAMMDRLLATLRDIGCMPEGDPGLAADENATSSVFITGHSLGAAVATIAMPLLKERGFKVRLTHVFESPRVGNAIFASVFQQEFIHTIPVWRVTYSRDPVPHLPPRFLQYEHVNYEVHYEEGGNYTICNATEDPRGAARYSVFEAELHGSDHCTQPMATNGSICVCPWPLSELGGASARPVLPASSVVGRPELIV